MSKGRKFSSVVILSLFFYYSTSIGGNVISDIIQQLIFTDEQFPAHCNKDLDSDGDRLLDCVETNTNKYISLYDTGTDPFNADSDGDRIKDGDEVLGTRQGLDLPSLGANPLRKNILIEYDWFTDPIECGSHSHRPHRGITERLARAFAYAPLRNPDGSTGIFLIQDYGQGGVFSGGNKIFDFDGVLTGGVDGSEFSNYKSKNFASNRAGYFHYVMLPHRYNTSSESSGQAELPGDDSIVSLYCLHSNPDIVANTIMHELGHNLKLRHGGDEDCNYKPNYNSVMNYRFQFLGVDRYSSCDGVGDKRLAYSNGKRRPLNEYNLDEKFGLCGTTSIDWNFSGSFSKSVQFDINSQEKSQYRLCGGRLSTLKDHDDWNNLSFLTRALGRQIPYAHAEIITETSVPVIP